MPFKNPFMLRMLYLMNLQLSWHNFLTPSSHFWIVWNTEIKTYDNYNITTCFLYWVDNLRIVYSRKRNPGNQVPSRVLKRSYNPTGPRTPRHMILYNFKVTKSGARLSLKKVQTVQYSSNKYKQYLKKNNNLINLVQHT